ncbi:Methylthioribulose-1-phosphate dehydratase [Paenibacillus sp. CECT 9249]|uniref:class II aldolase/adducin family protein n=1 Tax=Paenibacillus sp. CECT 9249 TaxID=2845385 RepID=UPI001E643FB0|nr:class II aldolase/adducin family protein [Paenibacillus sp. CECT 9249]CAH0120900.1 Methylthioribulose-1-phosphate dehydratase [Paenibacillus sp. CECT 9249]
MNFAMLHPADQIMMIMERIYGYGMTTTSGGNLSILDDNGAIWITPAGVDKGSLSRKDIVCVQPDGTVVGNYKPSSEFPFHELIYRSRKDIKAVLHAHPPALVAFSIVRQTPNIYLLPGVKQICGEVGMAEYGLPGSAQLGERIASVFERGFNTVMLENHGIVVGGENLFKAFMAFETLEFCARLQIKANRIGEPVTLTKEQIEQSGCKKHPDMEEFAPSRFGSREREARREMCALIHRAYDQKLFTSTQGTFSQRLEGRSFLITPYDKDRKYLEADDIVRIDDGRKEAGKIPSRSVLLHQSIYEKHPHIESIVIAHPPNIMAFAATKEPFDSRTIPESYILLRNIPKLPFGAPFLQPQAVADVFRPDTPIAMVENDCVIVTGSGLLNAFDRLEVAEYSAKAVISSKCLGEIIPIDRPQIAELERAFNL